MHYRKAGSWFVVHQLIRILSTVEEFPSFFLKPQDISLGMQVSASTHSRTCI